MVRSFFVLCSAVSLCLVSGEARRRLLCCRSPTVSARRSPRTMPVDGLNLRAHCLHDARHLTLVLPCQADAFQPTLDQLSSCVAIR